MFGRSMCRILGLALPMMFAGCGGVEPGDEPWDGAGDLVSIETAAGLAAQPGGAAFGHLPAVVKLAAEPAEKEHPAPLAGKEQVLALCSGGELITAEIRAIAEEEGVAFTLELWFRLGALTDQPLARADRLVLQARGGELRAVIGETELRAGPIVAREWYHVAIVVDESSAQLFLYGAPRDSSRLPAPWPALRGSFRFGGRDGGDAFCGELETIRLTRGALYRTFFTPEQKLHMHCSMVFGYDFDDETGPTVQDAGPLHINAKLEGEASLVAGAI